MTASLLDAIGAPKLIAQSVADYEMKTVLLATSPNVLAGLRAKILTNLHTSPLYDIERYTRHLEDACKRMWHIWADGRPPQVMTIAPHGRR